jgi:DNA-binding PadR family transcriptional regulator
MAIGRKKASPQAELNATAASLLGFLEMGPQSGYELAAAIETSVGNFWNITRSQVYRELALLEAGGYVRVGKTGVRERKPYTLTALGRRAFESWIAREPGEDLTRSPLLLAIFFGDCIDRGTLSRFLTDHRIRHERKLAEYRQRLPEVEREYPFPGYTMRFGLMYEEMILKWFDVLASDGLLPEKDRP